MFNCSKMLRLFLSLAFISLAFAKNFKEFPSEPNQAAPRVARCLTDQDCGNKHLECFKGYINGQPEQVGYCQNPWDFSKPCLSDHQCLSGLSCQPLDPTRCFYDPVGITVFPRRFPNDFVHQPKSPLCIKYCKVKQKQLGGGHVCQRILPRPPWKCDRSSVDPTIIL